MTKTLSIRDTLAAGFHHARKHLWFLVKTSMVIFFLSMAVFFAAVLLNMIFFRDMFDCLAKAQEFTTDILKTCAALFTNSSLGMTVLALTCLAVMFFSSYLLVGWMTIIFDLFDRQVSSVGRLFPPFKFGVRGFAANMLFGLGLMIGLSLFIIPGIIFALVFCFYLCVFVDRRTGIIECFKMAYAISSGARWPIFVCLTVFAAITIMIDILAKISGSLLAITFTPGVAPSVLSGLLIVVLAIVTVLIKLFVYYAEFMALVYAYRKLSAQTNISVTQ